MSALHVAERSETHEVRGGCVSFLGAAFGLLATAPEGVAKLRELILLLAMQGRLANQDPRDEPVDHLLQRIRAKKERLIAEGAIKRGKPLADVPEGDALNKLPQGWRWARMGDVASYIQRGKGPVYAAKSSFRVISQKCVRWYGLDIGPARCITQESLAKYEPVRFLQPGDLLWNSTGTGTIGRACLFPDEYADAKIVADSHVTVVRPLEVDARFLWRWVQSPYVQSQIEEMASGTTNQIELNTSTVVNQLLPLPPVAEQARIVARVEELMGLCDALEAHGRLQDEQHARLVATLFDALAASESANALAENWQRIATHFDLLLDRPEAVDALEQTILQLAVRGLLVPQYLSEEPASTLLARVRVAKDQLVEAGRHNRDRTVFAVPNAVPYELPETWCWASLGSLGFTSTGGTPPTAQAELFGTDIPFVKPGNLGPAGVTFDVDGLSFEGADRVGRLRAPSVLMVCIGGSIGKTALCLRECSVNQQINAFTPVISGMESYVSIALASAVFQEQVQERAGRGTLPIISKGKWEQLLVPVPPLAEQLRIVARVEQLRRLCVDLREHLQQSRATQSSLADALVSAITRSSAC